MDGASLSAAASTIAALLGILFVLAGAAYALRRLRGRLPGAGSGAISVLSSRALGAQQSLIVAEAEGQRFLLGVSRNGITIISRLGTP